MLSLGVKFPEMKARPNPAEMDQPEFDQEAAAFAVETVALRNSLASMRDNILSAGGVEGGAVILELTPGYPTHLSANDPKNITVHSSGIGAVLMLPSSSAISSSNRLGDFWFIANTGNYSVVVANNFRSQQGSPIAKNELMICMYRGSGSASNRWMTIGPFPCRFEIAMSV